MLSLLAATLSFSAAFSPTGWWCFFKQVREGLVSEILKAFAFLADQRIERRPGLVVELYALADHRPASSALPLAICARRETAVKCISWNIP